MINLSKFGATLVFIAVIFVGLVIVATPDVDMTTRSTPMEVVLQPAAATELEAQRLAAQVERMELEAAAELAQRKETSRQMIIMAVLVAALWALSMTTAVLFRLARHRDAQTVRLLPGDRDFDKHLIDAGGYYVDGLPYHQGEPVRRLEMRR